MPWWNASSWRGLDGEDNMTEDDWQKRGTEQAIAMYNGQDPDTSSPDDEGVPTGGCYNGDYSQETQDAANARLESDEYYEAEQAQNITDLYHNWQDR